MVVLVKCNDNTCTLALESRLTELINDGLVVQVLRNGTWMTATRSQPPVEGIRPVAMQGGVTAMASSF